MSYKTVDFDDGVAYVENRPRGQVVLHGPGGPHGATWSTIALVDTGADYTHLPEQAAQGVGISLAGATVVTIATAGGPITMARAAVQVEIEGFRARIPVNFAPNAMPLIGRQAIFAVLKSTGFTTSEWLLEWLQAPTGGLSGP